ncbi:MAG: hypothetical protein U1E87_04455 [Alphaproteobacteria bacterium]
MLRTPAVSRRQFIVGSSILASAFWLPSSVLAATTGRKRLVFILLRGGMDGLHAVAPYGDPNYAVNRGQIAIPSPGGAGTGLKLDGLFALHPSFVKLYQMYQAGEALFVHAVAPPCAALPLHGAGHFGKRNDHAHDRRRMARARARGTRRRHSGNQGRGDVARRTVHAARPRRRPFRFGLGAGKGFPPPRPSTLRSQIFARPILC